MLDRTLKIEICRVPGGNFGDDLNNIVWQNLFPNILETRNDCTVYGIGTILGGKKFDSSPKVVMGSGLGYQKIYPLGKHWDIRWVRGQLSTQALGIDKKFALGDGALLWSELNTGKQHGDVIGFIPHHATWESYDWQAIAEQVGLLVINPKRSPTQIANEIKQCSRIITESLHGALFADCLQIPWHPVVLAYRFNNFKWKDWLSIYQLPFKPSIAPIPLSNSIGQLSAIKNFCARTFISDNNFRYNSLRAVKVSTESNEQEIINFLGLIASNENLYTCSSTTTLNAMRDKLHSACKLFAHQYDLAFTL